MKKHTRVVVVTPHCSNFVPRQYLKNIRLSKREMLEQIDPATDKIYDIKIADKVIKPKISRFVLDLNRKRYAEMKRGIIINYSWDGKKVLKKKISEKDLFDRLKKYYDPFYRRIAHATYGAERVLLINGHSMNSVGDQDAPDPGQKRKDIMLGTSFGVSCSKKVTREFKKQFERFGYSVSVNKPYGMTSCGIHYFFAEPPLIEAITIEVNKRLYMNEKTQTVYKRKVKELNARINRVVRRVLRNAFKEKIKPLARP